MVDPSVVFVPRLYVCKTVNGSGERGIVAGKKICIQIVEHSNIVSFFAVAVNNKLLGIVSKPLKIVMLNAADKNAAESMPLRVPSAAY
jgi:hypothetical protein